MKNTHSLLQDLEFVTYFTQLGLIDKVTQLINLNTEESVEELKQIIINSEPTEEFLDNITPSRTIIIGNGDVDNYDHGIELAGQHGVDGIMIGRGIFRDPWAFLPRDQAQLIDSKENRINLLLEHLLDWQQVWGDTKHFPVMKKFVKMYISNFPGSLQLRSELMECKTLEEMVIKLSSQN